MAKHEDSVEDLKKFWEWGREKGYVKDGTASDILSAIRAVTEELEPDEKENFLKLNVEEVLRRFTNKKGRSLSLATQREYRLRLLRAIQVYMTFRDNPTVWPAPERNRSVEPKAKDRPATQGRSRSTPGDSPGRSPSERTGSGEPNQQPAVESSSSSSSATLTYPFPLRPGVRVIIQNLPADLKIGEAERLGAFLKSLAEDFSPN